MDGRGKEARGKFFYTRNLVRAGYRGRVVSEARVPPGAAGRP